MEYQQSIIQKWKLDVWMERINSVEDKVADIAEKRKTAADIENILIRNYARIVLCLKEVITLLLNGYPDGALCIARTVYELDIITEFIYKMHQKGDSTELIERYFADHNVKAYRNLKNLHEDVSNTSETPEIWKSKAKVFESHLQDIKKKYGSLKGEYWWANICFEGKSPSFAKIDELVNEDHLLRTLYKRACIGIHASAMGTSALLGRDNENGNMIYTSQTDEGFEAPLLLGMISHDRFVEVLCDYWKWEKDLLMCNMDSTYQEYLINSLIR